MWTMIDKACEHVARGLLALWPITILFGIWAHDWRPFLSVPVLIVAVACVGVKADHRALRRG